MDVMLPNGKAASPELVMLARGAVLYAMRSAEYSSDASGEPTAPDQRAAYESAVAAQARAIWMQEEAEDRRRSSASLSPIGLPIASASIGGASYTVETASSASSEWSIPDNDHHAGLCNRAWAILRNAGLAWGYIYG